MNVRDTQQKTIGDFFTEVPLGPRGHYKVGVSNRIVIHGVIKGPKTNGRKLGFFCPISAEQFLALGGPTLYLEDHPMTCMWLVIMVSFSSPNWGCSASKWLKWFINGGDPNYLSRFTKWVPILQVASRLPKNPRHQRRAAQTTGLLQTDVNRCDHLHCPCGINAFPLNYLRSKADACGNQLTLQKPWEKQWNLGQFLPNEPRSENPAGYFLLHWLVNRDPYDGLL